MDCKRVLFIVILLVFSTWCKEPTSNEIVCLKGAPTEVVSFFESDEWIIAIDSSIQDRSNPLEVKPKRRNQKLVDYDVLPPVFYVMKKQDILEKESPNCTEETNVCRVTIQNKNEKASFWFQKIGEVWEYKEVFWRKVRSNSPYDLTPVAKKPIIYLYPPSPMEVQVQLNFAEKLTYTYPQYPEEGWYVFAFPDGTLQRISDQKKFYSLFWEGSFDYEIQLDEGFVVPAESIEVFLESKLTTLGLNFKERQEFIIYWAPQMKRNSYSLVHFSIEEYEKQYPLLVTPKPDSEIRVNMVYKACDAQTEVMPQTLKEGVREGFTLVEWGGIDLDAKKRAVQ